MEQVMEKRIPLYVCVDTGKIFTAKGWKRYERFCRQKSALNESSQYVPPDWRLCWYYPFSPSEGGNEARG
jgi:hypothetical protein